jgi:hypothetical protein
VSRPDWPDVVPLCETRLTSWSNAPTQSSASRDTTCSRRGTIAVRCWRSYAAPVVVSKAELEARRAHLRILRKLRTPLLVATPIVVLVGVGALVLQGGEVVAFLVGVTWASYLWLVALVVQRLAGSGPRLMGPVAEGWTADELRALEHSGWTVMSSILLEGEDVDHVVLGRAGAFAIETKWSSSRWTHRHLALGAAARQARRNAAAVGRRMIGGQHRDQVRPVIAVWGEHEDELTAVDGVPVVHGLDLAEWLAAQAAAPEADIAIWIDRLAEYARKRTDHEARQQQVTRYEQVGILGLVGDVSQAAAAALATVLAGAYIVVFIGVVGLGAPLPLAVAGFALRRSGPLRSIGYGVIVGAVVLALLALTFVVIHVSK